MHHIKKSISGAQDLNQWNYYWIIQACELGKGQTEELEQKLLRKVIPGGWSKTGKVSDAHILSTHYVVILVQHLIPETYF